jgi:hypothetical protein
VIKDRNQDTSPELLEALIEEAVSAVRADMHAEMSGESR